MDHIIDSITAGQLGIGLFVAIVFLQSGLDKVFNWSANRSWIMDHFSKTFLAPLSSPMFTILTIVEVLTGLCAAFGVVMLLISQVDSYIYYGVVLSLISYLMLLFGQRVAQDYDGAKTIAIYFGVSLVALLFF